MRRIFTYLLMCAPLVAAAQHTFTHEQFIAAVLEHDFDIRIVANNAEMAANENNIGNAGYLPEVNATADQNWTINDARQEFLSGQVNEANKAKNTSLNAGVQLNWTFFDGFKMFARDKKLSLLESSAHTQLRAQMEMKVYQASASFYTLLVLEEMNELYESSIALSKARYDQIAIRLQNGAASEMELIQAQLDLTADSAAYLNNERAVEALKANLNGMIARDPSIPFEASGALPTTLEQLSWEQVHERGLADNSSLLLAKSALAISEQERKEVLSAWYPQLAFYAGYAYGRSQNEVGFLLSSQSVGPNVGFTLKWDILSGLSRIQTSKNSLLAIENAQLAEEKQQTIIQSELRTAFLGYEFALKNSAFEERNQLVAEEVEQIMQTAFESGAYTPLELREFQFAVVNAKSRLLNARLDCITNYLNVMLLSGAMTF